MLDITFSVNLDPIIQVPAIKILKSNLSGQSQFSFQQQASISDYYYSKQNCAVLVCMSSSKEGLICLFQVTHQFSFYLYVLPIVLFSILFNTPKFFELEVTCHLLATKSSITGEYVTDLTDHREFAA